MVTPERFDELYHEHCPEVFALCRARLGDEEEALDAAMEVFLRKWQAIASYDPGRATFRTWLWRNAERLCIDLLRKRARRPTTVAYEETSLAGIEPGSDGPTDLTAQVSLCLSALDDLDRQLLLMHEVEGFTWEEMAELTGLSVWQARDRVAKAIEMVKQGLGDEA